MFENRKDLQTIGVIAWIMFTDHPTISKGTDLFGVAFTQCIEQLTVDGTVRVSRDKLRLNFTYRKEDISPELAMFLPSYLKYPGKKPGLQVAFKLLQKKHKDWQQVLMLLPAALDDQRDWWSNASRARRSGHDIFIPSWRNIETYINNRGWEDVLPDLPEVSTMPDTEAYQRYMGKAIHEPSAQHLLQSPGALLTEEQLSEWLNYKGPFCGILTYATDKTLLSMFWKAHSDATNRPGDVYRKLVAAAKKIM